MLLTIIFDFRVIKLRNYHKISHLGHVNEILMQNPVCAMWRLIRVEQKIVWLYKQLVYCPDHNVITISQQWCDCTRPWSEGRREGGTPGSTWHCLCITFILPLYPPAHDTQHTAATSGSGSRENEEGRQYFDGKPSLYFTLHYVISVVLGVYYKFWQI